MFWGVLSHPIFSLHIGSQPNKPTWEPTVSLSGQYKKYFEQELRGFPHDHPPLPPKTGLIEVEVTDKLNGERPWAQRALLWITWAPKPMSYVLRGLCMGHCAVRLILFSGFVLYFAETPKPLRYVLYEPGWCYLFPYL